MVTKQDVERTNLRIKQGGDWDFPDSELVAYPKGPKSVCLALV